LKTGLLIVVLHSGHRNRPAATRATAIAATPANHNLTPGFCPLSDGSSILSPFSTSSLGSEEYAGEQRIGADIAREQFHSRQDRKNRGNE
jgi:hypothetical protein